MAVGPSASAVAVQFLQQRFGVGMDPTEKISEKMSVKIYSPCDKKWLLNGDPYNGGEFNGDPVGGWIERTHLKNMRTSSWIIFPQGSGWH